MQLKLLIISMRISMRFLKKSCKRINEWLLFCFTWNVARSKTLVDQVSPAVGRATSQSTWRLYQQDIHFQALYTYVYLLHSILCCRWMRLRRGWPDKCRTNNKSCLVTFFFLPASHAPTSNMFIIGSATLADGAKNGALNVSPKILVYSYLIAF